MATQVVAGNKTSEEKLIRAGQRGEAQALNILFRRHHKALFHSALNILGNPQDAEDALQEGLLSAFRNLKSFEGRSQFSTWLMRVVINAALMRRRRLAVRPAVEEAEPLGNNETPIPERLISRDPTPEQLFGRLEMREMIKGHLGELSPILRLVFVLRVVREYKTTEAARILCVPANTVKARLARARRQLATRLSRTLFSGVNATQISFTSTRSCFGRFDSSGFTCARLTAS